jgi:hypothetical protein
MTTVTVAATAALVAGCSSGENTASPTSSPAKPHASEGWAVPASTVLTAADLPGFTVQPLSGSGIAMNIQAKVEGIDALTYDPADCKAKDKKASTDFFELAPSGRHVVATRGNTQVSIDMLPTSDTSAAVFAAAVTGDCANVTISKGDTSSKLQNTKTSLPAGVSGNGFVIATSGTNTQGSQQQTSESLLGYVTGDGVLLRVGVTSPVNGTVDRDAFETVLKAAAARL